MKHTPLLLCGVLFIVQLLIESSSLGTIIKKGCLFKENLGLSYTIDICNKACTVVLPSNYSMEHK
jgi:hypothetical protein